MATFESWVVVIGHVLSLVSFGTGDETFKNLAIACYLLRDSRPCWAQLGTMQRYIRALALRRVARVAAVGRRLKSLRRRAQRWANARRLGRRGRKGQAQQTAACGSRLPFRGCRPTKALLAVLVATTMVDIAIVVRLSAIDAVLQAPSGDGV